MKIELVPNWGRVLRRAWTVWVALASALLGSAEIYHAELMQLLPLLRDHLAPGTAGKLSMALALALPVVRIIRQAKLDAEKADDPR
jgi:hypothetical protein